MVPVTTVGLHWVYIRFTLGGFTSASGPILNLKFSGCILVPHFRAYDDSLIGEPTGNSSLIVGSFAFTTPRTEP